MHNSYNNNRAQHQAVCEIQTEHPKQSQSIDMPISTPNSAQVVCELQTEHPKQSQSIYIYMPISTPKSAQFILFNNLLSQQFICSLYESPSLPCRLE